MQMRKRSFCAAMALLLVLTSAALSLNVSAVQIIENNDTAETATTIAVNTEVTDNLSGASDADWFCFTTSQDGYFHVSFAHTMLDSSDPCWTIRLYDSTGENSITGNEDSREVKGNADCTTPNYGVTAGTYYVKITAATSYSTVGYRFTVVFTAANDWETESNGSKDKADALALDTARHGCLTDASDADWYCFTVAAKGEISLVMNHGLLDSGSNTWTATLYDSTGERSLLVLNSKASESESSGNIVLDNAGTYYVKVAAADSYSDSDYTLTVQKLCAHETATKVDGKDPNCTETGLKPYWHCPKCGKNYSDSEFKSEIKDDLDTWRTIDKRGHDYGTPTYVWKGNECTAKRICRNDPSHEEIETVTAKYVKDTGATCTENEKGHYEATFANASFAKQTTDKDSVEKPESKLGHDYVAVVTPPTTSERGYTTHTCSRCHDSYVDSYTDPVKFKVGDVNGDGKIDSYDYQMLKAYVLGTFKTATEEQISRMNINGDKKIDSYDYQMLKAAVLGTYVIK